MTIHENPTDTTREAERICRSGGQEEFQHLSFYCIAIMVVCSLVQAGSHIMRELNRRDRMEDGWLGARAMK